MKGRKKERKETKKHAKGIKKELCMCVCVWGGGGGGGGGLKTAEYQLICSIFFINRGTVYKVCIIDDP